MSEREKWEALRRAAQAAHEAMQTWFSSEYLEHRVCRELGAALAGVEETATAAEEVCHTNNPANPGCGHPLSAHTRDVPTIPRWGIGTLGCSLCSCDAFVSAPSEAPDREIMVGRVESAVYRQDPGWSTGQTAARHALLSAWEAEVAAAYPAGWRDGLKAAADLVAEPERIGRLRRPDSLDGRVIAAILENDAERILALEEPVPPVEEAPRAGWMPGGAFCDCGCVEFVVPSVPTVRVAVFAWDGQEDGEHGPRWMTHTPTKCQWDDFKDSAPSAIDCAGCGATLMQGFSDRCANCRADGTTVGR